jgi:hypothetical protein
MPLFFVSCERNETLSKQLLIESQQNVFFSNFIVSLHSDKWEENIELLVFNKEGKLIDKAYCPSTTLLPSISYQNDTTLRITYNISEHEKKYIKSYLNVDPIILKTINVDVRIVYNYTGNGLGIDYNFNHFIIDKKKNEVKFFLDNNLIKSLNTNKIFSGYGKIEYREDKDGMFIYHKLICNKKILDDYYEDIINNAMN